MARGSLLGVVAEFVLLVLACSCSSTRVAAQATQAQPQPATIVSLSLSAMTGHHRRALRSTSYNAGGSSTVHRLDNSDAFWVFGSDGVRVIDTTGKLLHSISKDGLCKSREVCPTGTPPGGQGCKYSNDCNWGDAKTDGTAYVFATNTAEDTLVVFDIMTGILVAMAPTCGYPYYIDNAEWRDEVYVHCWRPDSDDEGSVDVFSTSTWGLNHPLAQASFNPSAQTHGYITLDVATPGFAYSTNLNDPGVHKLDINNRTSVSFINLTSVGCAACGPMSISGVNLHGYVQCYRAGLTSSFMVELDMTTDKVVHVHNEVSGAPLVTPDGTMVAVLNAAQDRVHTLKVGTSEQKADDAALQDILPGFKSGGLSRMAFATTVSGGKLAVLTSTADNFCLVLNLDSFALTQLSLPVPTDGNSSSLEGHGAAREVVAGLSQADGKLYAVIAASRMRWLHTVTLGAQGAQGQVAIMDTLSNVEGKRLVWVPKVTSASPSAAAQQAAAGGGSAASGTGGGSGSSDDSYKSVAIAGLVLGCLSMVVALALVAHRVLTASSGTSSGPNSAPLVPCVGGGCADPSMGYVKHVDHEMGGMAVARKA